MKFLNFLQKEFKEGKYIQTFKKDKKWCRVGKVNRKKWTVMTDSGLYDSFGSKDDAVRYAKDYVDSFKISKYRQTDDLNKGWL